MQYRAIPTNKGIDKTLYSNAVLKSRFKIDIKPLVMPQPKQEIPRMLFIGHKDTEKIFVKKNNITKKTNPTLKECKVCLFLFDSCLYLDQRIPITISKPTR